MKKNDTDYNSSLKNLCINNNIKLVSCESCTGGLLGFEITKIPGSSEYFDRGFITYSNSSKCSILGVSDKTIQRYGAVSRQVAKEMAIGGLKNSDAQYSVSITGIAGPGSQGAKPEGLVWFGMANRCISVAKKRNFGALGRNTVRNQSCKHALNLLIEFICSTMK
tara:strand:+ start:53 stop:547 length:495 start_codon:yes stop_codon:yes gene_type:complete